MKNSAVTLDKIKAPIKNELIKFEEHFKQSMKSNVALLDKIMYYIVQKKGKQIRPLLVFLCAGSAKSITQSTYIAASLVELLHTATLVHDDVVDDSAQRRGFFSINALWKNKIAVLVGDYLLSKGLLLALDHDEFKLLKLLSTAVREMSEGELLQMEKARKLDIEEHVYFDIIRQKTASLIGTSCALGASSSGVSEEVVESFRKFGEQLGIAFQVKDDLLDYSSDFIGKPKGIDIKEKKMTLPLIYALRNTDDRTRRKYIKYIKNDSTNPKKVKEIMKFVHESGGIQYAQSKMESYKNQALETLGSFPNSETRDALESLVHFVTARKK